MLCSPCPSRSSFLLLDLYILTGAGSEGSEGQSPIEQRTVKKDQDAYPLSSYLSIKKRMSSDTLEMAWDISLNVSPTGHNFSISLPFWWYLNLSLSRFIAVYVPTNPSSFDAELRKTLWWEFNFQRLPNMPKHWKFSQDGIRHVVFYWAFNK